MKLRNNPIVVLNQSKNPLNVGAVVRAMKNMGFGSLRLVQPLRFDRSEILRVAHQSEDLLDQIEFYDELDAALADEHFIVGTAADPHPDHPTTGDVRGLAAELMQRATYQRVILLFGSEADGLDRQALDRCHIILHLPTNPDYPALNLAQAALLLFYELHMADAPEEMPSPNVEPAPQKVVERLFGLVEEALEAINFFKHGQGPVMRKLRQIAQRAALDPYEVAMLMAIARQILYTAEQLEKRDE